MSVSRNVPPPEITEAARKVAHWFEDRELRNWVPEGCRARYVRESLGPAGGRISTSQTSGRSNRLIIQEVTHDEEHFWGAVLACSSDNSISDIVPFHAQKQPVAGAARVIETVLVDVADENVKITSSQSFAAKCRPLRGWPI
jgi:hypothetical protein